MEDAREFCDPLFAKVGAGPVAHADDGSVRYNVDLEGYEDDEISAELFTSHYYGCGGPGPFILRILSFNEKFVTFDLD